MTASRSHRFKVPMKWNFSPMFYSRKLKSMLHWFIIFEFGLRTSAYEFFSRAPKLANSSQNVRHSARGRNMQISTVDFIRRVKPSSHHSIWGEQAKEWENFSCLRACFSLHGRHCLAYIFERRSQKSTLLAICSDTLAQLQSDECVRFVPPFRTKF